MKDAEEPTIIFVYNAESGVFNLAADIAHKIFSPQTYSCNLCAITHSTFGMKNEWRDYLKTLRIPFEFLHADQLKAEYEIKAADFPAVYARENGDLKMIIDSAAINDCRTIDDLKRLVNEKLKEAKLC